MKCMDVQKPSECAQCDCSKVIWLRRVVSKAKLFFLSMCCRIQCSNSRLALARIFPADLVVGALIQLGCAIVSIERIHSETRCGKAARLAATRRTCDHNHSRSRQATLQNPGPRLLSCRRATCERANSRVRPKARHACLPQVQP